MRAKLVFALIALPMLAGCAGDRTVSGSPAGRAAPEPMGGRWMLAALGQSQCVMNLGGAADAPEGTIAPEGGCPGNFYTSRKWTFENGSLVIRDHKGEPLAQMTLAGPGRYDGKATAGTQVTLTR